VETNFSIILKSVSFYQTHIFIRTMVKRLIHLRYSKIFRKKFWTFCRLILLKSNLT